MDASNKLIAATFASGIYPLARLLMGGHRHKTG
jgi:hypothetical protein